MTLNRAVEDGAAGAAMAATRFACPIVRVRIFEGRGSAPHGCLRSHGSPRCRLLMILLLAVTAESTSLALTLNNQTSSKYYITLQLNALFFIMLSVLQNVFFQRIAQFCR